MNLLLLLLIISHIRYVFTDKIFLISKIKYPYSGNHEDGVGSRLEREKLETGDPL